MTARASASWSRDAVAATVAALHPLADPVRGAAMAAYQRDQFPFLGISSPARRAALRAGWSGLPAPSATGLARAARDLWGLPHREYAYAACDLFGRFLRSPGALDDAALLTGTVQELITTASWWDTVDALRSVAVGPLVLAHPELVGTLRRWIEDDDRWLVRSAIIHQLGYGARTDAALLFAFCARRAPDREFFVAKAVGWALRTQARRDPEGVRAFVAAHPELSPLARREALKHL